MKVKLVAVLIAVAVIFIGAVLWRTDSFVFNDRMSWVEAQTRTQIGSINHSLVIELKALKRVISAMNPESFQSGKVSWNALAPYYAVASFTIQGKELRPQTIVAKDNSKAEKWTADFVKSAVGNLGTLTPDQKFFVKPFQDSQRGRYVALLFIEGNRAFALFGSGEIFQSLIDSQKGTLSAFSIVTSSGLTVGHSVPEYLGTIMRDDPVFKQAQGGATQGNGIFNPGTEKEIYGMFEAVPESNLLVLSSAPLAEAMKGRSGLWWQFLLLGAGLIAVGIAAILWVVMPAEKRLEDMTLELDQIKGRKMLAPEAAVTVDPEILQKDKVQTSMRVASALAHEMSGPLAAIIGHSQMILAKEPQADITESADSILRETRSAREIVDKLLGYAGEELKEKNSMKVEGPLAKSLKSLEGLFADKGVKVIKNIQETSPVALHADSLVKALTNIFTNSVEAMERMPKKEILINLFEDSEGIHLQIADSGEGIEDDMVNKIFDPFFTTRSFQNHLGLGLSVVFGILKEHKAEVTAESKRGQGTSINILFHKTASAEEAVAKKEEVLIAKELPQMRTESAERQEAEAQYAEEQASLPKPSPLDINIDNLLELPDEAASAAPVVETAAPKMKSGISSEEELTFVDGFLDNDKTALASPVPEKTTAEAELQAKLNDTDEVDKDLIAANLIGPPKSAPAKKVSKLDDYQVEIRRPGKRI